MNLIIEKNKEKSQNSHRYFDQHVLIDDKGSIFKRRNRKLLSDLNNEDLKESIIAGLASDMGVILANEFEDLPTHKLSFKSEMKKILGRVIGSLSEKSDNKIMFFDLQMYYLFLMKKMSCQNISYEEWFIDPKIETAESEASNKIIEEFKESNSEKIIKIEYIDVLFVFFPNEKMKKTLKEMGFYDL